MRPPSPHSTFFSSLKQVEKRLKLETPTQSSTNIETNPTYTESLSTPIFIQTGQGGPNTATSTDSSEPPLAFLSQSPPIHRQLPEQQLDSSVIDEIDLLMQLLGLSDFVRKRVSHDDECCGCESGFYEKIVGVKGPNSKKEEDRLNGWINYFLSGGEGRMEPLRLGYLLLGKAACALEGGGLDFPMAIQEFFKNDPPPTTTPESRNDSGSANMNHRKEL